jgi:hypothetical protein
MSDECYLSFKQNIISLLIPEILLWETSTFSLSYLSLQIKLNLKVKFFQQLPKTLGTCPGIFHTGSNFSKMILQQKTMQYITNYHCLLVRYKLMVVIQGDQSYISLYFIQ